MELVGEAGEGEPRGLDMADRRRDIAIQGIHRSLASRAPEQVIDREFRGRCDTVGSAGRQRQRIGEEYAFGIDNRSEFAVLPQRPQIEVERALDIGKKGAVPLALQDGPATLSVPLSALSAENGDSYVWRVQPDNTLKRTPVRIGAFGEKTVPVLEGLTPTDWVVAAGVHVLHEGQQVRPVDRSNRVVNLAAKE